MHIWGLFADTDCGFVCFVDKITIKPSSVSMLGGDEILVSGPCLSEGQRVRGRIVELNLVFPCVVTSDLNAICVTPTLFKTGEFTFELVAVDIGKNYSASISSGKNIQWFFSEMLTHVLFTRYYAGTQYRAWTTNIAKVTKDTMQSWRIAYAERRHLVFSCMF